ncbi:MAG: hypothetical protein GQ531_11670 [Sulfurovum sp.]|nr:hypothetical protein [Sulfurovum sp.]
MGTKKQEILRLVSKKLFEYFVINRKYYALQQGNFYYAKNLFVNQKTIEHILENKESFMCYQEDNNYIKWICFDFDINKEVKESKEFEKNINELYSQLLKSIEKVVEFLKSKDIDYLLEFSGNRGIHLWILFDNDITRQDGYIIFNSILEQSDMEMNREKFSLDKYPKSLYSSSNTDKGTGVKIPLSFHQKSKKYALLFTEIQEFDLRKIYREKLGSSFLESQYKILDEYRKQNKSELFEKLCITQEVIEHEESKENFLDSTKISFNDKDLESIILSLSNCKHLKNIFLKDIPNEKERRIIVGLLGQLKDADRKIGKELLYEYFMSRKGAVQSIINQRLLYSDKLCPPTCNYFRDEYSDNCKCDSIEKTPLEFLDGFEYIPSHTFDFSEELFYDIKKSQIKYTKQNDEITLFHTLNNLKKLEYLLIKNDVENFLSSSFLYDNNYTYERQEENKIRTLYSISARDKIITTYATKLLDAIFYKEFSSCSFGYRFNQSFRQNDIFENWLKQWNIYIKELKTLIYSEDFKEYYILKLDLKSYYSSIDLSKLQIELKMAIDESYRNNTIIESEKKVYFNIIDNLLKLSKDITKNDRKGLPQGPAYARYLAELYLTSLDSIIEKNIGREGYYYRYVDDIFIIMPDKKSIDNIEKEIIQHLSTKYLTLNEDKTYKGMINNFKVIFEGYVDNTKYFIDQVQKHESTRTKTTIHHASSKLIELIENKDSTINDKNLSFLYTHLDHSPMVQKKKEELEEYVIKESKGRGSFFNIFWKYYFDKYKFDEIDFSIFNSLEGLKRESFFNSLIILLNGKKEIKNNTLKVLLDSFISDNLSSLEKLLLLEIYMLDRSLYDSTIVALIGDEIGIYNDLMLSEFSKDIPDEILHILESKLADLEDNTRYDYLYNIILFSDIKNTETLNRFSRIFINTVNTNVRDDATFRVDYLAEENTALKYIQLLYISTLFYNVEEGDDFLKLLYPIWHNLFYNLNKNESQINLEKLSYWKDKLEQLSLKDSNIHQVLPLLKNHKHYELTSGNEDRYNIISSFFDSLIEIIYLDNKDDISDLEDLVEIKQYLIEKKNVKYLEWLDGVDSVFYPSKNICLKNSIHNDITILKKSNQILVRLRSNFEFKKQIDYLTIQEESKENIFDGKYKTIIYSYSSQDYMSIYGYDYKNIFEFIQKLMKLYNSLSEFTSEYFDEEVFINFFYEEFNVHKESYYPLIPYEGHNRFFIKNDDKYNIKTPINYANNILSLINNMELPLIYNDSSKIFDSFEDNFFPRDIFNKLAFLEIFSTKIKSSIPLTIFELDNKLVETILEYLSQEKRTFYELIKIYLSYNRDENKKYILFDHVASIDYSTLYDYLKIIEKSLLKNTLVSALFQLQEKNLYEKLENLKDYKKIILDFEVGDSGIEINIDGTLVDLNDIEYLDINRDELSFISNVGEDKLPYLKSSLLFVDYSGDTYKLVVIPKIIEKVYSIIKDRSKAYINGGSTNLFPKDITLDDLKQEEDFSKAVKVLRKHYRNSEKFNTRHSIEKHLYDWLSIFSDIKDIQAMLYVIANHQYFSDKDVDNFIKNIQVYQAKNEYLITTLKTAEDNNGTHRLITLKEDEDLWRSLDLLKFPNKLLKLNRDKIVFLSDNMVSGIQTIKAFKNYYLSHDKTNHKEERNKNDYFSIKHFKKFKAKIMSLKEIVFISVLYTDKAKENIEKYFQSIGFHGELKFLGNEKAYESCVYSGLTNETHKELFKSRIKDLELLKENFDIPSLKLYKDYSEVKENDKRLSSRNIIVRFHSMTKKRFFIFTLKPKYYENSLFQYREDVK